MWSRCPEAEADMERLCAELPWHGVRDAMRDLWGVELTRPQVKSFRCSRGIRNGMVGGRFQEGGVPWNKGLPRDEWGLPPDALERMRANQFEPGRPATGIAAERWRPVGAEELRADGHVWVKVSDEPVSTSDWGRDATKVRMRRWRQRSHIAYEGAYGPIPEGCCVMHADGDPANDDPENLAAVPKRLRPTIAKYANAYADRETLETAALVAEVIQAARRAG